ncbi:hypothetical protein BJP34_26535 [Moorena producens PAL-8-15-08-1]|uniref:Uncharacterized protein n=1 Tax=Moorena producens PAL-8-15-08-1 TaxID=1458985 RepID=A0A1D8TYK6_9CYAN|nr:hypothetical protein [Moorena producens]AOX02526.1 hypothetical protein BJP34_26535 [Moorena producens PAL-8-15-08-1]
MKSKLRRIETTLNQLAKTSATDSSQPSPAVADQTNHQQAGVVSRRTKKEPSFSMAVQPFPTRQDEQKIPTLPRLKYPKLGNHRHGANPALAMNLLQDIEGIVLGWQQELHKILRQIQDLYLEGPIVDGWLESQASQPQDAIGTVRLANGDRMMDYVDEAVEQSNTNVTYQSPRTGYRLCGLDEQGQSWSRFCPADQVPSVSMAIARYQKLRQLLIRKKYLEDRLSQLAETLTVMHSQLNRP